MRPEFWLLALAALGVAQAQVDLAAVKALSFKQARSVLADARINGRVGAALDFRVTNTNKSFNYKLRATLLTPSVSVALARVLVTNNGLSEQEAVARVSPLLEDFDYLLVELDPREGSGVIPKEWTARLGPEPEVDSTKPCEILPDVEPWSSLLRAFPRDYAYDAFLLRRPRVLVGRGTAASTVPLVLKVQIREKTGQVKWSSQQYSR